MKVFERVLEDSWRIQKVMRQLNINDVEML